MTIPQVVDGVTDADAAFMNQLVDAANQANAAFNGAGQITTAAITPALGAYEPLQNMRAGVANVLDYGAVGDGVTDDTAAFQAACDTEAALVEVPPSSYRYLISEPIQPLHGQSIIGKARLRPGLTDMAPVRIYGPFNGPNILLPPGGEATLEDLWLEGNYTSGTLDDVGVLADEADVNRCSLRHIRAYRFGGPAVRATDTVRSWTLDRNITGDCLYAYDDLTEYMGAVDLTGTDHYIFNNLFGANGLALINGYAAAFVLRGGGNWVYANRFEISETGCVVADGGVSSTNVGNLFVGNTADLNFTHGYVVQGEGHSFLGNRSWRNSKAVTNTYDAFSVGCSSSVFAGSVIGQLSAEPAHRYGFNETIAPVSGKGNEYMGSKVYGALGTALYNLGSVYSRALDFTHAKRTYAETNVTLDRTYNANSTTLDELADIVGTLIADLREMGLVG